MKEELNSDIDIVNQLRGTARERASALKTLYLDKQLKSYIIGFVRRNGGNNQDGEDVFQDAIIVLDRRVRQDGYQGLGSIRGYLQGIAKKLWLRKRQQWNDRTEELNAQIQEEEVEESPETHLIAEERVALIRTILEKIGDRCKEILSMYKLKYSMEEIAGAMGLATPAVAKNEAYRCRQKFRVFVKENPMYEEVLGVSTKK